MYPIIIHVAAALCYEHVHCTVIIVMLGSRVNHGGSGEQASGFSIKHVKSEAGVTVFPSL